MTLTASEATVRAWEVFSGLVVEHGCEFSVKPMEPLDWPVPNAETGQPTGEVRHLKRAVVTLTIPDGFVRDPEWTRIGHVVNVELPHDISVALPGGDTKTITVHEDQTEAVNWHCAMRLEALRQLLCWGILNEKVDLPQEACAITDRERKRYAPTQLSPVPEGLGGP